MIAEIKDNVEILRKIKSVLEITHFDSDELQELCDNIGCDDFHVRLDDAEYRFIKEDAIEDIFAEFIQELFDDCYNMDDMPNILVCHIDWDGVVRDCMMDGYGHHFSSYDGSEYNAEEYYIFRTN